MSDLKRIEPGHYRVRYSYGFTGNVMKQEVGGWRVTLNAPDGTAMFSDVVRTLKEAPRKSYAQAGRVKMKDTSAMDGRPVKVAVNTPWCCNPASETYWSM